MFTRDTLHLGEAFPCTVLEAVFVVNNLRLMIDIDDWQVWTS